MNLLSHSPVDTPCPGYRYHGSREALLDEVAPLVATTPPGVHDIEGRTNVLCPVQVHVQDSMRRRQADEHDEAERRRKWDEDRSRKWIDLDENVTDGYILIDDTCMESGVLLDDTQEASYPEGTVEAEDEEEFSIYPLANSHDNAYREMSSRARYSELYSELAANCLKGNREEADNYSVANSHGDHSVSCENRDRGYRENAETDQGTWDATQGTNFEVANSHSNYRVYYDSQMPQRHLLQTSAWPVESWRGHLLACSRLAGDKKRQSENPGDAGDNEASRTDRSEGKSDSPSDGEPSCDIEQCLVQIEESLMNIEQNLLHVQDLDIPELRNLLYKSPSIEKSLYEVQDLLYTDSIVPAMKKKKKSLSLESDEENEEDEEEEEEEEEEEVWVGQTLTIKDNDDEDGNAGAGPFDASNEESSDTANAEENHQSESVEDRSNIDCTNGSTVFREEASDLNYTEKMMNFIPNSLNKTLPRRIVLDGAKENIRLCSSEPEETTIIDYNLNTACAEKKLCCRDKYHSRTNSLDENSKFPILDFTDRCEAGKSSLQDLLFDCTNGNSLDLCGKARSEEILQTFRQKSSKSLNRRGSDEKNWTIVEGKTEGFRQKVESTASHRRSTISGTNDQKRTKNANDATENATRPREKSRASISSDKPQDKDKDSASGKSFEKRKRKKLSSRSQSSSENALVPSKLISLSLSLLLAALLQAVRCLTDLVEDAFRSVSYDRYGQLQ